MLPVVGDIAWIELDPVKGSEQAGRRPALVLTSIPLGLVEVSRTGIVPIARGPVGM